MSDTEDDPRLSGTADLLARSGLSWQEVGTDAALRERVLAATSGSVHPDARPAPRRTTLAAAAAALVVVGGAGGYLLGTSGEDDPVSGPPGTLGAVEPVAFQRTPAGVEVQASLVAHTWGTETVLDVSGLPTGQRYTVVLEGQDGERLETGSFIAVEGVSDCRMNGAVLRPDVDGLRVLDADGDPVLEADLPDAAA